MNRDIYWIQTSIIIIVNDYLNTLEDQKNTLILVNEVPFLDWFYFLPMFINECLFIHEREDNFSRFRSWRIDWRIKHSFNGRQFSRSGELSSSAKLLHVISMRPNHRTSISDIGSVVVVSIVLIFVLIELTSRNLWTCWGHVEWILSDSIFEFVRVV